MRSVARDVTGERQLVTSAAAREVAGSRHQMVPDSGGTRVCIDNDILHCRERLQCMTEMRHHDHMAGADNFACDFGHQDGVIAIAGEAIECSDEPRLRNSQAQVVVEMKLIVELLQSDQIGFPCAPDSYRGSIEGVICSGHQVSYDGAPMFASSSFTPLNRH